MTSHPLDKHLGSKVKAKRTMKGMSQGALGAELDLTFQQVQKYEKGTNRISCSTLYEISKILEAPVNYFFEEYSESNSELKEEGVNLISENVIPNKEVLALVRAYQKINDHQVRKKVIGLIRSLADDEE